MAVETPSRGRSRISNLGDTFEIVIPSRENSFIMMVFICASLGGWTFGEFSAIRDILPWVLGNLKTNRIPFFLLFWLVGWTAVGVHMIWSSAWNLVGKEKIVLSGDRLILSNKALTFGATKAYALNEARKFRLYVPLDTKSTSTSFWKTPFDNTFSFPRGKLAFDYGMKTVRFAFGIDEPEARYLLSLLKQRGVDVPAA